MFDKIKKFYDMGLYTAEQVNEFVIRGKISQEEFNLIVSGESL